MSAAVERLVDDLFADCLPPTIVFARHDNYSQLSECKRYSVAAVRVLGVLRYEAFSLPQGYLSSRGAARGQALYLGHQTTPEAARELCYAHAAQVTEPAAAAADAANDSWGDVHGR